MGFKISHTEGCLNWNDCNFNNVLNYIEILCVNPVIFAGGVIYSILVVHLDTLVLVAMKIVSILSISINTPSMIQILCIVSDLKAQDFG
jgi:hypothetical protein